MNTNESERWFSTGFVHSDASKVDKEKGVIYGAKVIQVGEAKGHRIFVDGEFLDSVVQLGNMPKQGVKARFGHPNMCNTALGTFLGRWKGFYRDGDEVRANLFLSNTAKETPGGDLHSYVLSLADSEADAFGVSIAFSRDKELEKAAGMHEDLQIARMKAFMASDLVDEPAATSGGLFSAFANLSIAGQITEFLDLNPEIWNAFEQNPDILKALSEHGAKMDEFVNRYRMYRQQNGGQNMSEVEKGADAPVEEVVPVQAKAPEKPAVETAPEELSTPEVPVVETSEPVEQLSRDEFKKIVDEFGAEIAAQTVLNGGSYTDALSASHAALKAENEELRVKVAEFEKNKGAVPAKVVPAKQKASLFKVK